MVLVDMKVYENDKSYDIELDEDTPIAELIPQIIEMICQMEHCLFDKKSIDRVVLLGNLSSKTLLPANSTLKECGICNGDNLIFI